jgi:hypothetical protein
MNGFGILIRLSFQKRAVPADGQSLPLDEGDRHRHH